MNWLARIAVDAVRRVHEAERGRRDDRLLELGRGRAARAVEVRPRRTSRSGTGPAVSSGSWRVWPSSNGIVTPPGAIVVRPATGYVAKLGLRCSPSVTTVEPIASKRRSVSTTASSNRASSASARWSRRPPPAMPSMSAWGRGMLPMGSVGMLMRGTVNDRVRSQAGPYRILGAGRSRTTREGHMARDDERLSRSQQELARRWTARAARDPHRAEPDARAGRPPARPGRRAARPRPPGRHDQPRRARDAGDRRLRGQRLLLLHGLARRVRDARCCRRAAPTTSCRSSTSSSRASSDGPRRQDAGAAPHRADRPARRPRPHRGRRPGRARRRGHATATSSSRC